METRVARDTVDRVAEAEHKADLIRQRMAACIAVVRVTGRVPVAMLDTCNDQMEAFVDLLSGGVK